MSRTLMAAVAVGLVATLVGLADAHENHRSTADPQGRNPVSPELSALVVAPEDTGHHYDRDQWGGWLHHGNGCDTRELILHERGSDVLRGKGCRALAGRWVSPYTGATLTDPGSIDIDHLVPLGEANRSGVRDWTPEDRAAFANDPTNLHPVESRVNRQKGDQDPARWLPDRRCGYARQWVEVKATYGLSVDDAERAVLARVLRSC